VWGAIGISGKLTAPAADFNMLMDDDEVEDEEDAQTSDRESTVEGGRSIQQRRRPLTRLFRFKRRSSAAPSYPPFRHTSSGDIPPMPPVPTSAAILG